MQNKKLIRFVESFVLLPIITTTIVSPNGNLPNGNTYLAEGAPQVVLATQLNKASGLLAFKQEKDPMDAVRQARALAIDTYFADRDMPLAGIGMKMVEEAEKHDLDWRLLPAIAVRESTGGKFECKKADHNFFGWGSCKINFTSDEHAVEVVALNLAGKNPNTARHYENKTVKEILRAYNPPSVVPRYAEQVISIMNAFGSEELGLEEMKPNA